jgi:penicillin V acylase-like amidase (Ntn superfamily)
MKPRLPSGMPAALVLSLLLLPLWPAADARACTAFLLENGESRVIGKSYDFDFGNGMAVFNKAGVAKMNLPYNQNDKQAQWVSKYASLTFNQFGREMPCSGMNEKGLVVETLWLDESQYPPPDDRPTLNELQWVQYQLDSFATVGEMVEHAEDNRLAPVYAKVHYLACDAKGECAVFEFLKGKLVVSSGKKLAVRVLTNHTYAESLKSLKQHKGFGGKLKIPKSSGSLERFVRAAWMMKKKAKKMKKDPFKTAFKVLDSVRSGDFTKWNLVYDPAAKKVSFRTLGHSDIRSVRLGDFDRSCLKPVKILDMNSDDSGDVFAKFTDYTAKANKELSRESWDGISGDFPPQAIQLVLAFPESFTCTEAGGAKKASAKKGP